MAMRIGLVTGEFPPMQGGVGAFSQELSTALEGLGHEVHIITRVGCAGAPSLHPVVRHWGWRAIKQVTNLARRLDLDVLDIQYQAAAYDLHPAINFQPTLAGLSQALQGESCPVVVTFHDLNVPFLFPKAGPLRDWVVTLLAQQAHTAIVTNRPDELALIARGVKRVERIPIGSNITPAMPDGYDREIWREGLGVTADSVLLGFFGFFNARKGIETLIHAMEALDSSYHLLFIGGTVGSSDFTNRAYADRILGLIEDLGLSARVHFTGYVAEAEVSAAFAALDLCVLPYADGISFHHGTLMAALAHGQSIVSTRPPIELPELVHGENVWLVSPQDPEALAAAIIALAANPTRRKRLSEGAAELSVGFTWDRIAARTADLFESVLRAA
jgi:glycosyltransferase involved in cell wall biosynthesis